MAFLAEAARGLVSKQSPQIVVHQSSPSLTAPSWPGGTFTAGAGRQVSLRLIAIWPERLFVLDCGGR